MATVFDPLMLAQAMADVGAATHASQAALSTWQHQRLGRVLAQAHQGCALYRERLQGVDVAAQGAEHPHFAQLARMAPVTRGELMDRFSDWVSCTRLSPMCWPPTPRPLSCWPKKRGWATSGRNCARC